MMHTRTGSSLRSYPDALLPKIVVIGVQKAATSWLYSMLKDHPDCWVPPFKEIHYFDFNFGTIEAPWIESSVSRSILRSIDGTLFGKGGSLAPSQVKYFNRILDAPFGSLEWYRAIYAGNSNSKFGCDVTPSYYQIDEAGIRQALSILPDARFVGVVRSPVERALSHLKMKIGRRKSVPVSDSAWLSLALSSDIISASLYSEHLTRWLSFCPDDRLLLVDYTDLLNAPLQVMRQIEAHAGLGQANYPRLSHRVHASNDVALPNWIVDLYRHVLEREEAFTADLLVKTSQNRIQASAELSQCKDV